MHFLDSQEEFAQGSFSPLGFIAAILVDEQLLARTVSKSDKKVTPIIIRTAELAAGSIVKFGGCEGGARELDGPAVPKIDSIECSGSIESRIEP